MSVSLVARDEGVSASLLFQWRKLERQGALTAVQAGEAVQGKAGELAGNCSLPQANRSARRMVQRLDEEGLVVNRWLGRSKSQLRPLRSQMETHGHQESFKADYQTSTQRFAPAMLTVPSRNAVRSHQAIDDTILLVAVEVRSASQSKVPRHFRDNNQSVTFDATARQTLLEPLHR